MTNQQQLEQLTAICLQTVYQRGGYYTVEKAQNLAYEMARIIQHKIAKEMKSEGEMP